MTCILAALQRWSLVRGLTISSFAAALTIITAMPRDTQASEHRIIVGLATTSAYVTTWWHGPGSALDLDFVGGGSQYTSVYWQSRHMNGTAMLAWLGTYPGTCTGVEVEVYDDGSLGYYRYLGQFWYTHIGQGIPSGSYWWVSANFGWTLQYLGSVLAGESAACVNAGLWRGPHLHQAGDNSAAPIYTNWNLSSFGNPINPTGDYINRWMHRVLW